MKQQIPVVKLERAYYYLIQAEQHLCGADVADAAPFERMVSGAAWTDEEVEEASVSINSQRAVSFCNANPHTLIYTLVGRLWRSFTVGD